MGILSLNSVVKNNKNYSIYVEFQNGENAEALWTCKKNCKLTSILIYDILGLKAPNIDIKKDFKLTKIEFKEVL